MPSRFALTTPIYYVNASPHMGSAYTTMVADAIARYHRLRGEEVWLVTGTDEHGQKIQRTAEERGLDPQAHCDQIAAEFAALWGQLDIYPDRLIRTTDPRHQAIVKEFFQRVWQRGDIYQGQQKGWYCVGCETFYDENELGPQHTCTIHLKPTEWRDEPNYFFRLSRYQEKLERLYAERSQFIQPESRRNEVLNFVKQGLRDFSISRAQVSWGIPVPTDPSQTIYVWFDALLAYITALLADGEAPTLDNALKKWWPINLHLIGKDIVRFHAIYWPAMQMSAGIPISQQIFGHGFLTKDGQKMGKSLGNTLDPLDLVNRFGADAVRYYFLKEIELGRDGDFSETRFKDVINADLANDLGNLLNRTLNMLKKYRDYSIPATSIAVEHPLRALAESLVPQVAESYQQLQFSQACNQILSLVQASNKFLDVQAPWTRHKQGEQAIVEEILVAVLESVRLAAVMLSPLIPQISLKILQQLGFGYQDPRHLHWDLTSWGQLPAQQIPQPPEPVFLRLL
ncbi:MAG: methionine--tRNA ligase [Cyanobacteriota bacterium]|nr:methionine--tRNA ligase [Cyanobacteriota bacterium]